MDSSERRGLESADQTTEAGHELVEFVLVDVGELAVAARRSQMVFGRVLDLEKVVDDGPEPVFLPLRSSINGRSSRRTRTSHTLSPPGPSRDLEQR
jgi:hypothetical protein